MLLEAILSFCLNPSLESIPVLDAGRIKPFLSMASESLNHLKISSPKELVKGETNILSTFCRLSFGDKSFEIKTKIENQQLQDFFKKKEISYNDLASLNLDIRKEFFKQKEQTSYKKSLENFLHKIQLYENIIQGLHWDVYKNNDWVKANTLTPQEILSSTIEYAKDHPQDFYSIEIYYQKYKPFFIGLAFSIFSLLCIFLFPKKNYGVLLLSLSFFIQTIGLILRILISKRAPITNMYETVLFSGYGGLIISSILWYFKKDRLFLMVGLFYNCCCLLMLHLANDMLDASINPLVPVLRDNFWLSTHVTSVILSYAAFALSWVLSNFAIFSTFSKNKDQTFHQYSPLIYSALKFGIVFLATGIILGGVWADYSWGRFWGWDPKETWSLIVLLLYMAILHAKYTNWLKVKSFVFYTAFAFLGVMMAWFGVNYILASGLHSYGFSQGGAVFLGSFFILQITLLLLGYWQVSRNKS